MNALRHMLAQPNGRAYLAAALAAAMSAGAFFVVVAWHLYQVSGSSLQIGGLFVAMALPGLVLSPLVGPLLDRASSRSVCVGADLVRCALMALLALAIAAGQAGAPAVYAAGFVFALCDNCFQPAIAAMVRELVSDDDLLHANIAGSMAGQVGTLAGGGAAGLGLALVGPVAMMGMAAALFGVSAAWLLTLRPQRLRVPPAHHSATPRALVAEFVRALRQTPQRPLVAAVAVQLTLAYITVFSCNTLLPGFVSRELGAGSAAFGLIDAGWGVGALCGALLLGRLGGRGSAVALGAAGLLALGLGLALLACSQSPAQAALVYGALGALAVMLRIQGDTTIVKAVDPAVLGSIKSGIVMVISWASLVIYSLAGWVGDRLSVRHALVGLALLVGTSGMLMLLRHRRAAPAEPVDALATDKA